MLSDVCQNCSWEPAVWLHSACHSTATCIHPCLFSLFPLFSSYCALSFLPGVYFLSLTLGFILKYSWIFSGIRKFFIFLVHFLGPQFLVFNVTVSFLGIDWISSGSRNGRKNICAKAFGASLLLPSTLFP